jgi:Glycosyl hydrolase 36 superfamily, catalytic domain/Glycosyltransferase family 36
MAAPYVLGVAGARRAAFRWDETPRTRYCRSIRHPTRLAAFLLALSLASHAAADPVAPPPLSAESTPTDVASSYGNGHFGAWLVDGEGLPAFRYDVDEQSDPRAEQPELAGGTQAQHQVGNDHIVAAAFNHGYTQLWSQARLAQWANRWEPESRHFAGGYGYLNVDGQVTSTLYLDRPAGVTVERVFGVGYFRKTSVTAGVSVEQVVYAPFGDDPVLLDDVTITNRAAAPRRVSWFEYWDVNPYDQFAQVHRGVGEPTWDAAAATLTVGQSGGGMDDPTPYALFAAALRGPVEGYETSLAAFFGDGTRAVPAAVAADRLDGTLAPPSPPGSPGGTLFVFRAPLVLAPGETVTLRYAYGIARPGDVAALVAKYRAAADPRGTSAEGWRRWVPQADFGRRRRHVARELQWDAYLLRSASVYEEACGQHTITQGGYYQYASGANLGYRSWLHYLLPVVYGAPELAREILRYSIQLQPELGNQLPYGTGPLCTRYDLLGTSDDLDFWLLLAAAEYGLGSRDLAFFAEALPFYDTRRPASVWTHLQLAYAHQETLRGPHGGYLAGTNGDWSDFSAVFLRMTESMLVTAQVAYAYPRLADLAERLGDDAFAATLRARAAELRDVLRREWTEGGWYTRGYAGEQQIGAGAILGEPQPWAILAGVPTPREAGRLVGNLRRFLGGVGAPAVVHGPARIGSALDPARNDPGITEIGPPFLGVGDNASHYVGGVWFDVNGWLTWALGELDGVVGKARRFAWSEYTRNTLATHATRFPDHWAGTISVDDACWPFYSSNPARCGISLYTQYGGQITEQPTWMVMNAINLAGVTATRAGFRIAPHFPFRRFSLRLPEVGVAVEPRRMRGYVRVRETAPLELRVKLPPRAVEPLVTWAAGLAVPHALDGRFAVFELPAAAEIAADWAITWGDG